MSVALASPSETASNYSATVLLLREVGVRRPSIYTKRGERVLIMDSEQTRFCLHFVPTRKVAQMVMF